MQSLVLISFKWAPQHQNKEIQQIVISGAEMKILVFKRRAYFFFKSDKWAHEREND